MLCDNNKCVVRRLLIWSAISGFVAASPLLFGAANDKNPLVIARELAETRYAGKKYTDVDCVQFVLAVAEEKLRMSLGPDVRQAILIGYGWSKADTQAIAEKGEDPRLDGVAYALSELLTVGNRVAPEGAKAGDLIQYWMKKSDGTWFGHAGVISSVANGRAKIFGSHVSADGIADSSFALDLNGTGRRIAIVRVR